MQNLFRKVHKFGIGRLLLFILVLILIPGFILTVTLVNKFTPDDLFAHAGDKDVKTLTYLPASYSDIANQDGNVLTLADSGDGTTWIGGAQNPKSSYLGIRFSGTKLPSDAKIKTATLHLYSTEAQWIRLNADIYTDAALQIMAFDDNNLLSSRTLSVTHDSLADDVQWNKGKYYDIDVTNCVTEYLTIDNPQATEIGLIVKNVLATPWGRKFFSTNIDDPDKTPVLTVEYTLASSSSSSFQAL